MEDLVASIVSFLLFWGRVAVILVAVWRCVKLWKDSSVDGMTGGDGLFKKMSVLLATTAVILFFLSGPGLRLIRNLGEAQVDNPLAHGDPGGAVHGAIFESGGSTGGGAVPSPSTTAAVTTTGTAVPSPSTTAAVTTTGTAVPSPSTTAAVTTTGTAVPSPSTTAAVTTTGTAVPSPSTTAAATTTSTDVWGLPVTDTTEAL